MALFVVVPPYDIIQRDRQNTAKYAFRELISQQMKWNTDHGDVIKWKHFPRYWPFVRGIHRSPVNSPHKCQWRGALMFALVCAWINGWVNNREAGDLRRHRAHYDVTVREIFSGRITGHNNDPITPWAQTPQIAKTLRSTSIRHRSDAKLSDWCIIDVDPRIFAIVGEHTLYLYIICLQML